MLTLDQYEKFEMGRRRIEADKAEEEFEEVAKRIEGAVKSTRRSKRKKK